MKIAPEQITAGILAGGEGRRLGGIDKGWYSLAGQSLIERTIQRVRPQAARIVISANRSLSRYRKLGYTVHADDSDDHRGPLAGIATVLKAAATPYVLIVPVDTPMMPLDMAERLAAAMKPDTDIAIARTPERLHPLHALMRRSMLDDVQAALFSGVRRVADWQENTDRVIVDWASEERFANINSDEDARTLAERL
ncbi:molybdenum cofactor guanylyltransferase MobA [Salinisphaera sp. LB1]|uniref:molybdenum cofactor guanylyltransferase MobA n=1 Tax=Salinisphaera sp. LB1 TaxID=2183911 RepID=UPI000D707931|nr:molybdenum cofactor guanylyltransferase MobA [Salinisphaera sp. LB1]AWN15914.1 Molybdopterin-guanine dinucleotide biosynthesis protein MobA [Salinisphaera sp. LB1]